MLNTQTLNVSLRKAMSYAFNYPYVLEEIQDNKTERVSSILNKNNKYYNASIGMPYFNLTIAREVMIEAGYVSEEARTWTDQDWKEIASSDSPLEEIIYLVAAYDGDGGSYDYLYLDIFTESMKLIGLKVKEEYNGLDAFMEIYRDPIARKTAGDILITGWGCPMTDPTTSWFAMTFVTEAVNNRANLEDPEIEQWIEEASSELDPVKAQELVNKICNKIQNEIYYALMLAHPKSFYVISADWEGVKKPFIDNLYYYVRETNPSSPTTTDDNSISIGGYPLVVFSSTIVFSLSIVFIRNVGKNYLKRDDTIQNI
jgi:ABC-type transport system substrate-binding protein